MRARQIQPAFLRLGVALVAAAGTVAHGQMHHVDAPERVTRAIGVYEWTGELSKPTAARFVPVSLFIDGHFEDAGLYLARPIPFALQPGDIYALEHAGEPQGLLDLDFARRVVTGNAMEDDNPEGAWFGYGRFTPEASPKPTTLRQTHHLSKLEASAGPNTPAGTKLPADDSDGGEPHLSRRNASTGSGSSNNSGSDSGGSSTSPSGQNGSQGGAQSGSQTGSSSGGTTTASSTPGSSDDDIDRPTLRRRDPSQDTGRRREYNSKNNTSSVSAAGPALGDDPDRPILGHSTGEPAGTPELTGLPPDLHQAVAVSDAAHSDAHPFARAWDTPAERAETLTAMAALAKARLTEYLAANQLSASIAPLPPVGVTPAGTGQASSPVLTAVPATAASADTVSAPRLQRGVPQQYKSPAKSSSPSPAAATAASAPVSASSPAKPAATASAMPKASSTHTAAVTHTAHRTVRPPAVHAPSLTLGDENLSGFTLSYGGLPTFVYTAAASVVLNKPVNGAFVPSPSGAHSLVAYVAVVAQRLPTGELQMALSTSTDSAHLDRGPRLRLVDAVDPDDSHRASLLFELRGASSRQFALYRLTSARAEQTFTTASLE